MIIKTADAIYPSEQVRFYRVRQAHSEYDECIFHLQVVYDYAAGDGYDAETLYSGTEEECRQVFGRLTNALLNKEAVFSIMGNGTGRQSKS